MLDESPAVLEALMQSGMRLTEGDAVEMTANIQWVAGSRALLVGAEGRASWASQLSACLADLAKGVWAEGDIAHLCASCAAVGSDPATQAACEGATEVLRATQGVLDARLQLGASLQAVQAESASATGAPGHGTALFALKAARCAAAQTRVERAKQRAAELAETMKLEAGAAAEAVVRVRAVLAAIDAAGAA